MAEGKSAWAYVGTGCLTLGLIAAALAIGGGFWLHRSARSFERIMTDPEARATRVREVLGAERLPDGYHAMMAYRIPFRMQVAVLSGREAGPDGRPGAIGDRGLIYMILLDKSRYSGELPAYFEGRTSDPAVLAGYQILVEADEVIGRGLVNRTDATLRYLAQRGRVAVEGFHGEGVTTLILVDCADDARGRVAIWFEPDPAPGLPLALVDLAGTPADPEAIASFMGQFRLCGGS